MLKAPKHSDSLLTFRILPSFHPTPKGVGFPARKFGKKSPSLIGGAFSRPYHVLQPFTIVTAAINTHQLFQVDLIEHVLATLH